MVTALDPVVATSRKCVYKGCRPDGKASRTERTDNSERHGRERCRNGACFDQQSGAGRP